MTEENNVADTCGAVQRLVDEVLTCDQPKKHTDPTGAFPQGTPHEDSTSIDVLSDEPRRWWG